MTKITTILLALAHPQGLNRFEAERLGDHVLPSTIASLRAKGYAITAKPERVPTRFGGTVRVMRYWLEIPA